MRLVTWNCNMRLHDKLEALKPLGADILVLPESARPEIVARKCPGFRPRSHVWVGENPNKGLGIVSFNDYELALDATYSRANQFVAPCRVTGRSTFNLVAIWSNNDRRQTGRRRRPGPVLRALDESAAFCREAPLIVAGDFNHNVRWDRPGRPNNMENIAAALAGYGLVSAYHHSRGVAMGTETDATLYWRDRSTDGNNYHIDYVFVPQTWVDAGARHSLGSFADWVGSGLSDHVPLILEVPD